MHQLGIASTGHEELRKRHAAEIAAMTKVWLTAWDPVKQKEVWRVPYARRGSGGALVTGGNLVFQGTIDANFAAYRADTGAKLWEMPVRQVDGKSTRLNSSHECATRMPSYAFN